MNDKPSQNSTVARDPFYIVKEKVHDLITKLSFDFDRWRDLLETTNTSTDKEFAAVGQSLRVAIKKLNYDLNDLAKTISIVTENRLRFKDISDQELDSRKKFVNDMKAIVDGCEETLNSDRTKRKLDSDQRESLLAETKVQQRVGLNREIEREGDEFVENKHQEQLLLQKKQDVVLDDMSAALARLGDISDTINVELKVGNKMLGELDVQLGETEDKMNIVMLKLDKLLGNSDRGRLGCIIFLILVAVALILALVYT